jgi:myo-inositol-1(or 4)-monophosphatase
MIAPQRASLALIVYRCRYYVAYALSLYSRGGHGVQALLEVAETAALAGGRVLESRRGDLGEVRSKTSMSDLVTDVDVAAGFATVRAILTALPNARFVIEEEELYELAAATRGTLDDAEVWVIDPLDGTTSFVHGYPNYSVSVAVLRHGTPVVGAVYNAALGELNSAALGQGAYRDAQSLRTPATANVNEALLITGFPYDRGKPLDRQLAALAAFLRVPVHGIRRDGSAALDCCHVAGARADGFWEFSLFPWDVAAGIVILREAGAVVTDAEGDPWTPRSTSICAANPVLHKGMLEVLAASKIGG